MLSFTDLCDPRIASSVSSPLSGHLSKGQCLVVTGPNGSGKTTLLTILATLTQPQRGHAEAVPLFYCGHQTGLKPSWTVKRNLDFRLRIYNKGASSWRATNGSVAIQEDIETEYMDGPVAPAFAKASARQVAPRHDEEKFKETLARFTLKKYSNTPLEKLSRGQQQHIALISGYLSPYALWILDEPFAHLDQEARAEWQSIMNIHCQQGGVIVYSTHHRDFLQGSLRLEL